MRSREASLMAKLIQGAPSGGVMSIFWATHVLPVNEELSDRANVRKDTASFGIGCLY